MGLRDGTGDCLPAAMFDPRTGGVKRGSNDGATRDGWNPLRSDLSDR